MVKYGIVIKREKGEDIMKMGEQGLAFGIQSTAYEVDMDNELDVKIDALDGEPNWYHILSASPVKSGYTAYVEHDGKVCSSYQTPFNACGVSLSSQINRRQNEDLKALQRSEPEMFELNYVKFIKGFLNEVKKDKELTNDEKEHLKNMNTPKKGEPAKKTVELAISQTKEDIIVGVISFGPKDLLVRSNFVAPGKYDVEEHINENFENYLLFKVAKIANRVFEEYKIVDRRILDIVQPNTHEKAEKKNDSPKQVIINAYNGLKNTIHDVQTNEDKQT